MAHHGLDKLAIEVGELAVEQLWVWRRLLTARLRRHGPSWLITPRFVRAPGWWPRRGAPARPAGRPRRRRRRG